LFYLTANRKKSSTKPKGKPARTGNAQFYLSPPYINATLVSGSLKKIVVAPKNVDPLEWLAANSKCQASPDSSPLRMDAKEEREESVCSLRPSTIP
jgi:hypothetical protein